MWQTQPVSSEVGIVVDLCLYDACKQMHSLLRFQGMLRDLLQKVFDLDN